MTSTTFFSADAPRRNFSRLYAVFAFVAYAALLGAGWLVLSRFAPDHVSFRALGHTFAVNNVHQKILANALTILLILPSVLWVECAVVGWPASSIRALLNPSATVKTDLALFILEQFHMLGLIGRVLMLGASIISGVALHDWLARKTGFAVNLAALPMVLQVAAYFYIDGFFDYWSHRLGHTKLFWPLHRYHHSAEEFCVINGGRIHPAGFASIVFINVPMGLLGATPEVMIWVNIVTVVLGFLIHSRITSGWGWIGRYVVQSPLHHRLHHKLDMSEATGFFGMTPIWDHLFGGWSERKDANVVVGVDTHYAQGWFVPRDMLRDYRDFFLGFIGKRKLSPSEQ